MVGQAGYAYTTIQSQYPKVGGKRLWALTVIIDQSHLIITHQPMQTISTSPLEIC